MAEIYQRFAAERPAVTTEHRLYVGDSNYNVHAILSVCNQTTGTQTYSVAHCPNGHGDALAPVENWRAYQVEIDPGPPHEISLILTNTESVRIKAGEADAVSFMLTGVKYSGGDVCGILASARPANTSEALLYTCPAGYTVQGSVSVSNQTTSALTYRMAICGNTHGDNPALGADWRCFDVEIGNNSPPHEISVNLKAGESIRIKSSQADGINFLLSGYKIEIAE